MAGKVRDMVRKAQESRSNQRRKAFQGARGMHEGLSRRSGASALGIDENGNPMETRSLKGFKIVLDRWHVGMSFKHENKDLLENMSWREVERMLKEDNISRSPRRFETHVIPAVRALKHVRQGYDTELGQTDELLATLDQLNMALAAKKSKHTDKQLQDALKTLTATDSELTRKQVAVKYVVARGRITEAKGMLETALKMEGSARDLQVARACAILVSIRNRLGAWRDKQVSGIAEYNLQKECALRTERDRWLFAQFARFAVASKVAYSFWLEDPKKLNVLVEIKRMIRTNVPQVHILDFIAQNNPLFKVDGRRRRDAETHVARCQAGIQPKVGAGIDYLIGHYAWLYRYIRDGKIEKTKDKIRYLGVFVRANKPDYIHEELSKDPDPYLLPVLGPLGKAVAAFEAGDIPVAQKHFAACRDLIRPFAYPGVRR